MWNLCAWCDLVCLGVTTKKMGIHAAAMPRPEVGIRAAAMPRPEMGGIITFVPGARTDFCETAQTHIPFYLFMIRKSIHFLSENTFSPSPLQNKD